jgi:hypothetical protein
MFFQGFLSILLHNIFHIYLWHQWSYALFFFNTLLFILYPLWIYSCLFWFFYRLFVVRK